MAKDKASASSGFDPAHVRNIGIAAHVDAGKTTLTERVLFYTGASHKIGEVHAGNTTTDFQPEEQLHGITITAAVVQCPWAGHLVQIVDTPGHVDFTIEVERSMRVLDGAVIVMDGVRGVEPQTETVWRQANKHRVPRFVFVNKMDRPGADFDRALKSVHDRFGDVPVPVCVPVPEERTVLHVIERQAYRFGGDRGEIVEKRDLTEAEAEKVAGYRETLLLAMAEHDEALAEKVLMEQEVPEAQIWAVLRTLTLQGRVRPAFSGSALRNWGVQPVLDAVVKLLPNPLERPPSPAKRPDGSDESVVMGEDGPLAGLVFKVQLFEGRRHCFLRLYRGRLEPGDEVRLGTTDAVERVARVFQVDANKKSRLDLAVAGQIVLLAGLRHATTGDTLCDPEHPVLLERIDARDPVLGLAVEPESSADEEKMLEVLRKVCEEDPTLRFEEDADTGQKILKGMGELHLQIVFERIEREFGLRMTVGKPRVVHRETVGAVATASGGVDRVIDGSGQGIELKAGCVARVEPTARGSGVQVVAEPVWEPAEASPTADQRAAVEQGASDALAGGPIEGAPLQDVRVRVEKVTTYGTASGPTALRIAAATAVREALVKAGGLLLQPIMRLEVIVPEENTGTVLGDLQARGAVILGHEPESQMSRIEAECGLSHLIGYTTDLRSNTRGRGQFVMEFDRFDVL
jgi:elongation factor G